MGTNMEQARQGLDALRALLTDRMPTLSGRIVSMSSSYYRHETSLWLTLERHADAEAVAVAVGAELVEDPAAGDDWSARWWSARWSDGYLTITVQDADDVEREAAVEASHTGLLEAEAELAELADPELGVTVEQEEASTRRLAEHVEHALEPQ